MSKKGCIYNSGWDNTWDKNPRFRHDIIIDDLIGLNESGMTLPEIADSYGVSRHCIMGRFKKANVKPINWRYKRGWYQHSRETKNKIGKANKSYRKNRTWEEIFGKEKAKELKEFWAKNQRRKFLDGFNPIYNEKSRSKMRLKAIERCKDRKYLKKLLTFNGQNKEELFLEKLLQDLGYPFKFVGDGKVVIDGKCPDFIMGSKIVEYFGSYWHDPSDEFERTVFFNKRGYDVLIIWDYEMKNLDTVKLKIRGFCGAGN